MLNTFDRSHAAKTPALNLSGTSLLDTPEARVFSTPLPESGKPEDRSRRRSGGRTSPWRVVDFGAAVLAGGFDAIGRPRIAAVSAEATRCVLHRPSYGRLLNFHADSRSYRANAAPWRQVRIVDAPAIERPVDAIATVPSIPPRHRPARGDLRKYVILFEANWSAPPVDPYLLRRLSGRFGVIVAHWNLTELERAVLA